MPHKPLDDLVRMLSELGIIGIVVMIFALILAVLWILLPFVVCAVQSSTLSCRRELRALNSKLDQILHTIEVQSKAAQDVSHLDGTHSTTANGQVP